MGFMHASCVSNSVESDPDQSDIYIYVGPTSQRSKNANFSYTVCVHCTLSAVTHAPFHASMLRPASQAGPMHETAGVGKLVNAALLSSVNEACVNVCCATLL